MSSTDEDLRKVQAKLQALAIVMPRTMAFGLYALGLEIIRRAARVTPVDTGRLRASSFVVPPEEVGSGWRVVLGYAANYALFVHEGTSRMEGRQWLRQTIATFTEGEAFRIIEAVADEHAKKEFKGRPSVRAGGISKKPKGGD